jgi:cell division protein FtsL
MLEFIMFLLNAENSAPVGKSPMSFLYDMLGLGKSDHWIAYLLLLIVLLFVLLFVWWVWSYFVDDWIISFKSKKNVSKAQKDDVPEDLLHLETKKINDLNSEIDKLNQKIKDLGREKSDLQSKCCTLEQKIKTYQTARVEKDLSSVNKDGSVNKDNFHEITCYFRTNNERKFPKAYNDDVEGTAIFKAHIAGDRGWYELVDDGLNGISRLQGREGNQYIISYKLNNCLFENATKFNMTERGIIEKVGDNWLVTSPLKGTFE